MKSKPDIRNIKVINNIINSNKNKILGKYNNNNYILIKSLYNIKDQTKNNKLYNTEQNKSPIGKTNYKIFTSFNKNKMRQNLSQKQKLINVKRYQKIIPKKYIYNFISPNDELKIENSAKNLNN